jgi:hypothetical protein
MDLTADSGLNMTIDTAEPGSASQQALEILAGFVVHPSPTRPA